MNILTCKRMLELEEMARTSNIKYPLSLEEWRYIERAEKMSLNDTKKIINYYIRKLIIFNERKIINELLIKYNLSEKELFQRFEDVNRIMKYQEAINNNLLKEQRRMIKKINQF